MRKCTVTAASNMSGKTYEYLCEKVRAKFGDDIEFTRVTDESVIGGFILDLNGHINGHIFDLSLATQLKAMGRHLREE